MARYPSQSNDERLKYTEFVFYTDADKNVKQRKSLDKISQESCLVMV